MTFGSLLPSQMTCPTGSTSSSTSTLPSAWSASSLAPANDPELSASTTATSARHAVATSATTRPMPHAGARVTPHRAQLADVLHRPHHLSRTRGGARFRERLPSVGRSAARSAACAIDRAGRNTPLSRERANLRARDPRSASPEAALSLSLGGDAWCVPRLRRRPRVRPRRLRRERAAQRPTRRRHSVFLGGLLFGGFRTQFSEIRLKTIATIHFSGVGEFGVYESTFL